MQKFGVKDLCRNFLFQPCSIFGPNRSETDRGKRQLGSLTWCVFIGSAIYTQFIFFLSFVSIYYTCRNFGSLASIFLSAVLFQTTYWSDFGLQINDRYEFPLQLDLDRENGRYLSPDADRSVRNLYTLHRYSHDIFVLGAFNHDVLVIKFFTMSIYLCNSVDFFSYFPTHVSWKFS